MSNDFLPREYWEERLSQDFSLSGVGFAGLSNSYNQWLYKVRRVVLKRALESLPPEAQLPDSVLDVGCGTGFYVDQWRQAGVPRIAGCDLTSVAVRNLASRFPDVNFYQCDIGDDVIELPGTWDCVSAFDVLFHIVDDQRFARAIQNIYELLNPGGYFIFSDNLLHGSEERLRHQVHRTLSHVEDVLNAVGFQVLRRMPMFCLMNYPIDSPSRLRQRAWNVMARLAASTNLLGGVTGALLYPVELCLTAFSSEGASTEMMICRKPNA